MDGDLHFEVVLGRSGEHRLYFSDAMREELPAATAAGVTVTVTPKAQTARRGRAADRRHRRELDRPGARRRRSRRDRSGSRIRCTASHTSSMCRFRASEIWHKARALRDTWRLP